MGKIQKVKNIDIAVMPQQFFLYKEGELQKKELCANFALTAADGKNYITALQAIKFWGK